jgi:hypothetical protein
MQTNMASDFIELNAGTCIIAVQYRTCCKIFEDLGNRDTNINYLKVKY